MPQPHHARFDGVLCFFSSTNPCYNLALEEFLLLRVASLGPTLLLYVNDDCVVMGKHQNPRLECRSGLLLRENIPLLRRITGGGTVFHDRGNLNFSFLMPKGEEEESRHYRVIQGALSDLGISSTMDSHKSLWHGDRKFSGSAFARKLIGNIHHGTLLIRSDLSRLEMAITPELVDLETKAPRSRRAMVMNLAEVHSDLSIDMVASSLVRRFEGEFPGNAAKLDPFWSDLDLSQLIEKNGSAEWVFGSTPHY